MLKTRGNDDPFLAFHYAQIVYNIVKDMLDKHNIAYKDESCSENFILLITDPDKIITQDTIKEILCIFDCVSKRTRYILESEVGQQDQQRKSKMGNIEASFMEEAMNHEFNQLDDF